MQTKPVFSLLLSMSVPMMLSMLIQSLYNIVDSIYVSRLGTDALKKPTGRQLWESPLH